MRFGNCPVVGVPNKHIGVSTQIEVAYAYVFGEDTNHGAKVVKSFQ